MRYTKLLAACLIHLSIGAVYAWSTLVQPIAQLTGWQMTEITFAFSLIILFLSFSAYAANKVVAKYGIRNSCRISGIVFCLSLAGIGLAVHYASLFLFYLFAALTGVGIGICYILPVDMAMKWFPDKKGFAGGACVMAFGFGSAIAAPCFQMLTEYSIVNAMVTMATVYFLVIGIATLFMDYPENNNSAATTQENCDKSKFMPMFAVFFINIACGIALLAAFSPMVQEMGATAMEAATMVGVIGIANGLGRIIYASLSDRIGRKQTYTAFFFAEALLFILIANYHSIYAFVIASVLIISMYGGGFAVMPAFASDVFGTGNVQKVYGKLLLAWGIAGMVSPPLFAIAMQSFAWQVPFFVFATMFALGAFLLRNV